MLPNYVRHLRTELEGRINLTQLFHDLIRHVRGCDLPVVVSDHAPYHLVQTGRALLRIAQVV